MAVGREMVLNLENKEGSEERKKELARFKNQF